MLILNMLGKPCPIPVVQAKKELAKPDVEQVQVLVDNIVAVQNLEKMANGLGYRFEYQEQQDKTYAVLLKKKEGAQAVFLSQAEEQKHALAGEKASNTGNTATVLCITKDYFGEGSRELGQILIKGFLFSVTEWEQPPYAIVFLNSGVHLLQQGSNAVEDLQCLAEKGVKILGCGTCLNYYQLSDKMAIGEVVDMFAISTLLNESAKVITI